MKNKAKVKGNENIIIQGVSNSDSGKNNRGIIIGIILTVIGIIVAIIIGWDNILKFFNS